LTTEASGKLLQKLSGHAIYSKPESLKYKTPDPPRTFTTDAGDIIIERWTGTSYSRIMRPGVFDSYHEEVVKDFVKLCYESRDEIKKEMPEKK
jgi:hypothetical protein